MKRQHKTSFYVDGRKKIEFCTVCSAEGDLLRLECIGDVPDKSQSDFFKKEVDSDKEPT
jgi:hypothetical protein